MSMCDIVITGVNVIITVVSIFSAYNSSKYYKKSKSLTAHTNINKALLEIEKMLNKLPEALTATNIVKKKRGENQQIIIADIGTHLNLCYNEIHKCIPVELSNELGAIEACEDFNLQTYINRFITCDVLSDNYLNLNEYNRCQECLHRMQQYLKVKLNEKQEELK